MAVVEVTNYYAQPGKAAEVLAQRRAACAIRLRLGLSAGRVFCKMSGHGPDVRWECAFEGEAAFEADLNARRQSAEFEQARSSMHKLLERFERHVEREVAPLAEPAAD